MNLKALGMPLCAMMVGPSVMGQDFVNGDLEGPSPTSLAIVAPGWQNVPSEDPVCLATDGSLGDTPDLTDSLGPSAFTGIFGNAYSGATFMSGERADSPGGTWDFQEGIMQGVSGFVPDSTYTIRFYQSVVKSYGSYDTSGSWAVYAGNMLIGITEPTTSLVPYDSYPFIWEERTVSFTASSSYHTIKFLPEDDDTDLDVMAPNGSLRMGIDMISLLHGQHLTSVGDAPMADAAMLWPNPFIDRITLWPPRGFKAGQVSIYSSIGALVHQSALGNGDQRTVIDLPAIGAGAYVVRVMLDGTMHQRVMIKE